MSWIYESLIYIDDLYIHLRDKVMNFSFAKKKNGKNDTFGVE